MSELNTNNMAEAVETTPTHMDDGSSVVNLQTGGGGDGFRLGLEKHVGGQAEVQSYNQEMGVTYGWDGNAEIGNINFKQTGGAGTGVRLGLDQPSIAGQAEVQSYSNEPCADALQTGGGSPFNNIMDPDNGDTYSIFSYKGKSLLKSYVKALNIQNGGWAPVDGGADPNISGALHDGIPNQGAENVSTNLCDRTFDAQQPMWDAVQLGGGVNK
jgi:hypothetical protein